MTEEEKKAIEYLRKWVAWETAGERNLETDIETLLNLIEKQQNKIASQEKQIKLMQSCDLAKVIKEQEKEIEQLANGIRVLGTNSDITTEEIIKEFTEKPITEEYMKKFESSYISKDEVLKAMGYEENDEEYEKLKQDNEKLLAILDTMYSEFCRLEDIEDKKVEVAVAFIEEKRDKYWQDKINNKIKELDSIKHAESIERVEEDIELLKELLEE